MTSIHEKIMDSIKINKYKKIPDCIDVGIAPNNISNRIYDKNCVCVCGKEPKWVDNFCSNCGQKLEFIDNYSEEAIIFPKFFSYWLLLREFDVYDVYVKNFDRFIDAPTILGCGVNNEKYECVFFPLLTVYPTLTPQQKKGSVGDIFFEFLRTAQPIGLQDIKNDLIWEMKKIGIKYIHHFSCKTYKDASRQISVCGAKEKIN